MEREFFYNRDACRCQGGIAALTHRTSVLTLERRPRAADSEEAPTLARQLSTEAEMRVEFVNEDERVIAVGEMPHAPRVGEKVRILNPREDGAGAAGALFEVTDVYYWVPDQQAPIGEERLFAVACELVDVYVRPVEAVELPEPRRLAETLSET
jgi:hypothetical protein